MFFQLGQLCFQGRNSLRLIRGRSILCGEFFARFEFNKSVSSYRKEAVSFWKKTSQAGAGNKQDRVSDVCARPNRFGVQSIKSQFRDTEKRQSSDYELEGDAKLCPFRIRRVESGCFLIFGRFDYFGVRSAGSDACPSGPDTSKYSRNQYHINKTACLHDNQSMTATGEFQC